MSQRTPVPVVIRKIADNIETKGHYKGWSSGSREGRCCVYINPADRYANFNEALVVLGQKFLLRGVGDVVRWNDTTDTVQVVKTLRNIADELEKK